MKRTINVETSRKPLVLFYLTSDMLGQTGTMGIQRPNNHPETPTVTQDVTSSTPETLIPTNSGKKGFLLSLDLVF